MPRSGTQGRVRLVTSNSAGGAASASGLTAAMPISSSSRPHCAGWLLLILLGSAGGSNPVVQHTSVADPHIHIFNDTAYMYAGRDRDQDATSFVMPDWRVWSWAPESGGQRMAMDSNLPKVRSWPR